MFFFTHITGFLIQLLPCLVLYMRAFHKEQYRIRVQTFSTIAGAALFGISCVFAYVLYTVRGQRAASSTYSNGIMSVTAVICLICFVAVVSAHIVQKLMTLCICVTYSVIVYITSNIIWNAMPPMGYQGWEIYYIVPWAVFLGVTVITFPFMDLFIRKVLRVYFEDTDLKMVKQGTVFLTLVTGISFLIFEIGVFLDEGTLETFWLRAVYFGFSVFCLVIIYWFLFWEIQSVRKQESVQKLLEIQQLQYERLRGEVQNTLRIQHDMRQQYRVLEGLLSENKVEEALERVEGERTFLNKIMQKQFCKNPGINALFQYYAAEAEHEGIRLHITVDALPSRINDTALTILIGNMLENAVFSCKSAKQSSDTSYISLKMGMVKNTFAVYMENTCEEVRMTGKRKRNGERYCGAAAFGSLKSGRGFGLGSMEAIAEKYGGTAEFCFEKPVFYTRISMKDE